MSQNSIITTVLVILALTVGVYFWFLDSHPHPEPINYDNPKELVANDLGDIKTSSGTASIESASNHATPLPNIETKTEAASSATSSEPVGQATPVTEPKVTVPVVVKNKYTVNIKGAIESLSKPFAIKVFDSSSVSEEFTQEKLVDGVYKFESEKVFSSLSISVAGYAPVLKENLIVVNNMLTIDIELDAYAGFSGDIKSFLEKPIPGAKIVLEKGTFKKVLNADTQGEFKLGELA